MSRMQTARLTGTENWPKIQFGHRILQALRTGIRHEYGNKYYCGAGIPRPPVLGEFQMDRASRQRACTAGDLFRSVSPLADPLLRLRILCPVTRTGRIKRSQKHFSVVLNGEIEGTESRRRKHLFFLPICAIMGLTKSLPPRERGTALAVEGACATLRF